MKPIPLLVALVLGLLLILLILGLLTVLVITPWFVVSTGQVAPLPVVTTIPIPVTQAPPWAVPEIPNPTSNSGDLSLNGISPTETGR